MANEVSKGDKQPFSAALSTSLAEVKDSLPGDFNVQRFVHNAVALLNENKTLAEFTQKNGTAQVKQGMLRAAYLGLDFMSKEAYLIPYGNTLNFTIDYRGLIKLAKKYSVRPVKDIYAKVVREGDNFSEGVINGEPTINFTPKPFNNGEIIGAFAVCLFEQGGMIYDSMSYEDIEVTRKKSKSSNGGAWKDYYSEMAKKVVLRRLCKMIEMDFDNATQISIVDEDGAIETDPHKVARQDIAENANTEDFVIDADATEVPFN